MLDLHLVRLLQVRERSLEKHLETSHMTAAPHKDLVRLQEERQVLQERVEVSVTSVTELEDFCVWISFVKVFFFFFYWKKE